MKIFQTAEELRDWLHDLRASGSSIGFVPTMGALHQGHISLIEQASNWGCVPVASIFVNPTQFNDPKDLHAYPRTPDEDAGKLAAAGCKALYMPTVEDVYPVFPPVLLDLDLGPIADTLEGKFRPGHFLGMATVVKRLFDIVEPNVAFFGEKDYQQMAIISHMVNTLNLTVKVIGCNTVREADGLAMSSRNVRLSDAQRKESLALYKALLKLRDHHLAGVPMKDALEESRFWLSHQEGIKLDYLEVVIPHTLMPPKDWVADIPYRALVAAKVGEIRLIDNIEI